MVTLRQIDTRHPDYRFVEELLHSAFPKEERRDDEEQRRNTDENDKFGCYLVTDRTGEGDVPIGFITLWSLDGFHYVEHLATQAAYRNCGYGREILSQVEKSFPGVTILEVECPDDEMSVRRIGFYGRCGFQLCKKTYMQPPYRRGDKEFPLLLMYRGTDGIDRDFDRIRDEIHHHVYGVVRS